MTDALHVRPASANAVHRGGPADSSRGPRLSAASFTRRLGTESLAQNGPVYRALAHRIRGAVLDGRLAVASGVPSERDLALVLGVSRTTVAQAYALLREQGWLASRRGSGSRLQLPDADRHTDIYPDGDTDRDAASGSGSHGFGPHPIGPAGIFGYTARSGSELIDLSTASLPAPAGPLAAAVAAAAADLPTYAADDGYAPFGLPVLREAIAEHYARSGLPTTSAQILVTNGAQHAFTLALHELSTPGDRVLLECPTYPVALDAIRAARRIPGPVAVGDPSGNAPDQTTGTPDRSILRPSWDMELIAATLRQTAPRLAFMIPDFQNPTGALMDLDTRQRLVAAARDSNTLLLVDESFRDVPFPTTPPLPPRVAAFDDGTRVLSLGSMSKAFWGGLRVGWIRAAPALINRLGAARALADMSGPVLDQLVAARLLADPDAALATQRERLATGAAELADALATDLPSWRPTKPPGGACLWVALPGPFAAELARLAPTVGVRIAPGPRFGPDGTMESYLRLPFTRSTPDLRTAVRRLATIADRAAAARPSAVPGWLA